MIDNAQVFHLLWSGVYSTKISVHPKLLGVYANMIPNCFNSDLIHVIITCNMIYNANCGQCMYIFYYNQTRSLFFYPISL